MEEPAIFSQLIGELQELREISDYEQQHRNELLVSSASLDRYWLWTVQCHIVKKRRTDRNGVEVRSMRDGKTRMDKTVWREFPVDLFELVMARLPIAAFLRFRLVCKQWNELIHSSSFLKICVQTKKDQPWLCMVMQHNGNAISMCDPSSNAWYHPGIPDLPSMPAILPVATCEGLICFLDISHRLFFVCNPVTRCFKALPSRAIRAWSWLAVGMRATSGGYRIVCAGCNGEFEVYDSVNRSWNGVAHMPESIALPLAFSFRPQGVCIGEMMYFIRSQPAGFVSYNMTTGLWQQLVIPDPLNVSDQVLVVSGDRLMLVGILSRNAVSCICVWELQKMTLLWKEVDRMPNEWCLEFYGMQVKMYCLGSKDVLMLLLKCREDMVQLIKYKASTREWSKIPRSMLATGKWPAWAISFTPHLAMQV